MPVGSISLSVLLVEDHPDDAALIAALLEGPGRVSVALTWVQSLAAALEALEARGFDGVLLDLSLPDARGVQAVTRIRAARAVPVVVLTGRDDDGTGFEALDVGAADYLTKARIDRPLLARTLYHAVQAARIARDLEAERNRVSALNAELQRQIAERSRAMVALEAANRLKAQFLDVVSHELRTPLTPIVGYARILLRKPESLDLAQRQAVEQIQRGGARLQEIIDQILAFRTLRSEPVTVRPTSIEPRALLERLLARRRCAMGHDAPVALALVADDLPRRLVVDAEQVEGIVGRLLENAVTYTPHGRVELRTRYADERWTIEVRDSGVGIEAEHLDFIFGAFYQAEPSMTRTHGGLGLGLAYARFLAEALGGELGVRSTPGQGSAFRLVVPAMLPERALTTSA